MHPLPIMQYVTTCGSAPPLLVWACERAGMFVGSPGCQSGGWWGSPSVSRSVGPDRRQGCRARVYAFCRGSSAQLKSQVRP